MHTLQFQPPDSIKGPYHLFPAKLLLIGPSHPHHLNPSSAQPLHGINELLQMSLHTVASPACHQLRVLLNTSIVLYVKPNQIVIIVLVVCMCLDWIVLWVFCIWTARFVSCSMYPRRFPKQSLACTLLPCQRLCTRWAKALPSLLFSSAFNWQRLCQFRSGREE